MMGRIVIPDDVKRYIARRFAPRHHAAALALLSEAVIHDGSPAGPRLLRCAAVSSGGSIERLRAEVHLLKIDYRDVIMGGEYQPAGGLEVVHVRDLNQPIPDDL